IRIRLLDGQHTFGTSYITTPLEVAQAISKQLSKEVVVAVVDNSIWDLQAPLTNDCSLKLLKFRDDPLAKQVFWHSSSHLLGYAMEKLYGSEVPVQLCNGPPLEQGNVSLPEGDLNKLEKIAVDLVKENLSFERIELTINAALEMFRYNPYKIEIIKKLDPGDTITAYKCGDFIDLCRGPHLPRTGMIKAIAMTKESSVHKSGDTSSAQLQRVYGIAFPKKDLLKDWLKMQQEAKERDHRTIGKDQKLFFFNPLSPGNAFLLPHGLRIINKLKNFLKDEYRVRGYHEVETPLTFNQELWVQSGHWDHYSDDMFRLQSDPQDHENRGSISLKPMNCPGHCLIFGNERHSYRDLPVRLAEFSALHRDEPSGSLGGLTRLRQFHQDDAHIFCTKDQIGEEVQDCLDLINKAYSIFDFNYTMKLSTRPEGYLGETAVWEEAENRLVNILNSTGKEWSVNDGDGAFYGPKIDVMIQDAIGRSHQTATIQLDFQLPKRFNLQFMNSSGELEHPVIIHRAIFGSFERFLGILIEHTAGNWPFWISPRQVSVCSVSERHNDYAREICDSLKINGLYADLDITDVVLNRKIRLSRLAGYNYIAVVGKEEFESK
ncbi:uncharacterized protein TRIADDRAFT_22327, partial [Trichoplax adhaerens]